MLRFCPRLRFSLRTMLALVTVLSFSLGHSLHTVRKRRQALAGLDSQSSSVIDQNNIKNAPGWDGYNASVHPAPLGAKLWGQPGVVSIAIFSGAATEEKMLELKQAFPEARIIGFFGDYPNHKVIELPPETFYH